MPQNLAPVAALVNADEDTQKALATLTTGQLNRRPGTAASAAYHRNMPWGVSTACLTYARGDAKPKTTKRAARTQLLKSISSSPEYRVVVPRRCPSRSRVAGAS